MNLVTNLAMSLTPISALTLLRGHWAMWLHDTDALSVEVPVNTVAGRQMRQLQ